MTFRPAGAAAAIALGLAFFPIIGTTPAAAQTSPGLPTEVALVVPLTVPAADTGLISATRLENYTSEFGLLTRALDQVADRPVTLAIDPMIIASIRVLGDDAPESATLWLDRLAAVSNESFALTWADSDLTLPIYAGHPGVLEPESLDFAINPARFSDAPAPTEPLPSSSPSASAEPTPAPDDTPPPLPTTESLLEWNYTLASVGWPASDTVTSSALQVLSSTFDYTLLSSGNLSSTTGLSATGTAGEAALLVSDSTLSALFSAAVAAVPGSEWEAAVAAFTGALAASAGAPGASSAVLALDRGVSVGDSDLGTTIDQLQAVDTIALVGLSAVADNPGPSVSVVDKTQDAASIDTAANLLQLESLDSTFAQIAEDPSLITSERRLDLLATFSNAWAQRPNAWKTATEDYRAASTKLRSSVNIVKSSSITLWADRGSLPVIVDNELDQPITVYITVRPLTPLITVEDPYYQLVVEPNSQRKAPIPVQSISNGVVELQISLHGRISQQIGSTTYVRTTVQAGWETPFTVGVAILVVLVFAAGIVRTVFRLRRAKAERITIA